MRSAVAMGILLPVLAFDQGLSVTAVMQRHNVTWTEALGAVLLADFLGLDATFILSTGERAQASVFVLAPALVIYREGGSDPIVLVEKHRKGRGWGVLAHELGVHPGIFNKTRGGLLSAKDAEIEGSVWIRLLSERYGVDSRTVNALRSRGLSWGDVLAVIHVGYYTKKGPHEVLKFWEHRGKSWGGVCKELRVSLEAPKHESARASGKGSGSGKGKGHGKPG